MEHWNSVRLQKSKRQSGEEEKEENKKKTPRTNVPNKTQHIENVDDIANNQFAYSLIRIGGSGRGLIHFGCFGQIYHLLISHSQLLFH